MNDEDLKKKLASEIIKYATPTDLAQLIKDGVIKQIGKSYYTDNIHKLPDDVAKRVKSTVQTKKGTKLTFYKVTKSIKKKAEKLKKRGYKKTL